MTVDRWWPNQEMAVEAQRLLEQARPNRCRHGARPSTRVCSVSPVSVKVPFEAGEYLGRLNLPLGPGDAVLDLRANRPPTFRVHGYGPMSTGGFPKPAQHHSRLTGRLRTNHDVVLGDAQLEDWGPLLGLHRGSARWALVGLRVADHEIWERVYVQVSGLESILRPPMEGVQWPSDGSTEQQQYSAFVMPYPVAETTNDGVHVHPRYNVSFSISDLYQHQVTTVAEVRFRADEPRTVDAWIAEYVEPLTTLVGIATGRVESLRLVVTQNGEFDPPAGGTYVRGVLFGSGIGQDPKPAERQLDSRGDDIVPLFTLDDSPPLASLIATWQAVSEELPALPLLRLSQDPGLHPNVRFLLLAHAAESLHARPVEEEDLAEYGRRKNRFKEALAVIRDAGLTEEHRFLRENAEPRRPYPLSRRLRELLKSSALASRVDDWDARTADLDVHLRTLDIAPTDLADRLAQARNVVSHGVAHLPPDLLRPAATLLDLVVRLGILTLLGFTETQVDSAAGRLSHR